MILSQPRSHETNGARSLLERQTERIATYRSNPAEAWTHDHAFAQGSPLHDPQHTRVELGVGHDIAVRVGVHRAIEGSHDAPVPGDIRIVLRAGGADPARLEKLKTAAELCCVFLQTLRNGVSVDVEYGGRAMLKRASYLVYGVAVYVSLLTFIYTIGFVGNLWPSLGLAGGAFRGMDFGGKPASIGEACLIDLLLVLLFAVQHSVMARTTFKSWWTRFVPAAVERSTFVLATSLCLLLLFWQWRPIGTTKVWDLSEGAMRTVVVGLSILGWIIVLSSTFMIDHFDLFGLRQVCDAFRDRTFPEVEFSTPALYKAMRHPIYSGFMIAFWSTPTMTIGHLVFAAATSGYILVAVRFEERDLVRRYGDAYRAYRRRTRMFAPFPRRHGGASSENVSSM